MDPASDRRLGRAALVITALLIAVVAISAAIAYRYSSSRGPIEIPAGWRSTSDYTLIIFGRTSCDACEASAAFHKELAAAASTHGIRVLAASTSSADDPAAFASSIGVAADRAIRANPAPKNLQSVPAIVLVTRDGTILRHTEGTLTAVQQQTLIAYLATIH